jgi:hypothetical protein
MNALIYVTVLAGTKGMSMDAAAIVWLFLLVVEWLANQFAGWLWHCWVERWSALQMRAMVQDLAARLLK